MLALFKGELSVHDLLYGMSFKNLAELRDIRLERLRKETEDAHTQRELEKRNEIRNRIMR